MISRHIIILSVYKTHNLLIAKRKSLAVWVNNTIQTAKSVVTARASPEGEDLRCFWRFAPLIISKLGLFPTRLCRFKFLFQAEGTNLERPDGEAKKRRDGGNGFSIRFDMVARGHLANRPG